KRRIAVAGRDLFEGTRIVELPDGYASHAGIRVVARDGAEPVRLDVQLAHGRRANLGVGMTPPRSEPIDQVHSRDAAAGRRPSLLWSRAWCPVAMQGLTAPNRAQLTPNLPPLVSGRG